MADAKKSLSSYQLGRDLDLHPTTAWRMQQRIRSAIATDEGKLLQGIIEMNETYVGGKPRYKNRNNKRGRGASGKTSGVGAVERGGEVKARVTGDTKGRILLAFIQEKVEMARSALVTDEYAAYRNAGKLMPHVMIDHQKGYVDPLDKGIHTNTIEGFWRSSNAPGMARIITIPAAGCPSLSARPAGNTTSATIPTVSTPSCTLASGRDLRIDLGFE